MKKKLLAGILAVSMVGALLTGCGKGTAQNADASGTQAAAETAQASTERAKANEIVIGIAQDLDQSLDPHYAVAAGTKEVMFNVFEGLVKYDSNGDTIPAVASDVQVSDDGLVYTFTLRDGVKFHNGDTVDLDDVIYSIQRCRMTPRSIRRPPQDFSASQVLRRTGTTNLL